MHIAIAGPGIFLVRSSVPATDRRSSWIRLTLHSGAPVPCPPGALYIQPLRHACLHMPRALLHLVWLSWYARLRPVVPGAHLDERTQQQATRLAWYAISSS